MILTTTTQRMAFIGHCLRTRTAAIAAATTNAAPVAMQPRNHAPQPKIPQPDAYDGTRDLVQLNNYTYLIKKYYLAIKVPEYSVRDTFHFHLKGEALIWYQTRERDITTPHAWTLTAILDDLVAYFRPKNEESTSFAKLKALTMSETLTMANLHRFTNRFQKLALSAPLVMSSITEAELMRELRYKLRGYEEGFRQKPNHSYQTIQDYVREAENFQTVLDLRAQQNKTTAIGNQKKSNNTASNRNEKNTSSEANKLSIPAKVTLQKQGVDTDKKEKEKEKGKLSAAERTTYMKEGRCFKCKQVGHRSSDESCPDFRQE